MPIEVGINLAKLLLCIEFQFTNHNMYKYLVVHSAFVVQSLLRSEEKPDVYDLPIADGIKEMLIMKGFTRDKILNSTVSTLAETLQIDYYVALLIYKSAKK
jgi:hypothetical protein